MGLDSGQPCVKPQSTVLIPGDLCESSLKVLSAYIDKLLKRLTQEVSRESPGMAVMRRSSFIKNSRRYCGSGLRAVSEY